MNKIRTTLLTAATIAVITLPFPVAADVILSSGIYQETGDAGDRFSPQAIGPAGTLFSGISGNIGNGTDFADAYEFFFAGGNLFAKTSVETSPGVFETLLATLYPSDPIIPTDPISPIYSNLDTGVAGWNLVARNYIIEFSYLGIIDPPISSGLFTLNPDTTTNPTPAVITAPIPEPHTWALLVTELMGFTTAVRQKRR
jgi:hypothetical protein